MHLTKEELEYQNGVTFSAHPLSRNFNGGDNQLLTIIISIS